MGRLCYLSLVARSWLWLSADLYTSKASHHTSARLLPTACSTSVLHHPLDEFVDSCFQFTLNAQHISPTKPYRSFLWLFSCDDLPFRAVLSIFSFLHTFHYGQFFLFFLIFTAIHPCYGKLLTYLIVSDTLGHPSDLHYCQVLRFFSGLPYLFIVINLTL